MTKGHLDHTDLCTLVMAGVLVRVAADVERNRFEYKLSDRAGSICALYGIDLGPEFINQAHPTKENRPDWAFRDKRTAGNS